MVTGNQSRFRLTSLALAVGICATAPAWADPEAADTGAAPTPGLAEVVVTARKVSESLQTTPVAVTALSEAALTRNQIYEVSDLQASTPDIAIAQGTPGPSSTVYISIRGEAQNNPNSASDSAVGIYIDGVYIARPIVGNAGFLDVSQVEVLRGPQGTLFGRNTTGGAISITTNQPTDTFEGYIQGGFGNYSEKFGQAVLNLPLIGSELDSRVAFRYESHDAYFSDPFFSDGLDKLRHDYEARAELKWSPSSIPSLNILWEVDYEDQVDTGPGQGLVGFNASGQPLGPMVPPLGVLVGLLTPYNMNNYLVTHNNFWNSYGNPDTPDPRINTPFSQATVQGYMQTVNLDVGESHVKSISAYRWSDSSNAQDLDGTPVSFGGFYSLYREHQASQELQISGKTGKFDWIGGGYYLNEAGNEESLSNTFGFAAPLFAPLVPAVLPYNPLSAVNQNLSTFQATSYALFGQTNYHITDTVRATAGYRYTWDVRDLTNEGRSDVLGTNLCAVGVTAGTALAGLPYPCSDPFQARFSYPAWTVGLDWQVNEDTFVYIKSSKADMAGGFNTRPVPSTVSPAYGPESNKDVELGLKSDLLQHHLRTDVALFHGWQANVQRITNAIVNDATTQYQTNSGKTQTYGAELEITVLPWTGMEIRASGAYLHAAYNAGTFTEQQALPTGQIVTVDRSNEPVPQAPKETFSLAATQSVPTPVGKLSFHADWAYRSSVVYTQDTASPLQPASVQQAYAIQNQLGTLPSYGLVNARVALNMDSPNLEVALWGRNLADKQYYTEQFDSYAGLGTAMDYKGAPRTYGGTVTYRFK